MWNQTGYVVFPIVIGVTYHFFMQKEFHFFLVHWTEYNYKLPFVTSSVSCSTFACKLNNSRKKAGKKIWQAVIILFIFSQLAIVFSTVCFIKEIAN
jgi:hypothetical protein